MFLHRQTSVMQVSAYAEKKAQVLLTWVPIRHSSEGECVKTADWSQIAFPKLQTSSETIAAIRTSNSIFISRCIFSLSEVHGALKKYNNGIAFYSAMNSSHTRGDMLVITTLYGQEKTNPVDWFRQICTSLK